MKIKILTLFPEMFAPLKTSIIGRAVDSGAADIEIIDIRDYSQDKHKKCDDAPFGGGAGMVMMCAPIYNAVTAVDKDREYFRVFMSPSGETLTSGFAEEAAKAYDKILILCGHYEGVDRRVIDMCFDKEVSIGDYVLTGGELAAMVFTDAVLRFSSGVLGSADSAEDESFAGGLLEYPQYTRPYDFMDEKVPDILISGHHENIKKWRLLKSEELTKKLRPDLFEIYESKKNAGEADNKNSRFKADRFSGGSKDKKENAGKKGKKAPEDCGV